MSPKHDFGKGLRLARKAAKLSQEDFSDVSSRTYVSSLERGIKTPTLEKIEDLAEAIGCHPLTLTVLAYLKQPTSQTEIDELLERIRKEVSNVVPKSDNQ